MKTSNLTQRVILNPLSTYINNNRILKFNPYQRNITRLIRRIPMYNFIQPNRTILTKNFSNNNLINYSHKYEIVDTTFLPIKHDFSLPKIQMGIPIDNSNNKNNCNNCNCCCNNCKRYNIQDILVLLNSIPRLKNGGNKKRIFYYNHSPENESSNISEKKKFFDDEISNPINIKRKIKLNTSNSRVKKDKIDWWKLARDFFNLFVYIKTAIKYSKNRNNRNQKIKERKNLIGDELLLLKNWIISIEQPFWNEFKVFKNLNLSFKSSYPKVKIEKEIQKITAIIKKYLENLIFKTQNLNHIPSEIQKILYNYIKEKNYFPKQYLSTYQINRLDFHFYGGTRMINESQRAMLLSFLLINGITVQQILLHMSENFLEFNRLKDIEKSAKIIGSIMHYLTSDSFKNNPKVLENYFALLNYYRNYHIKNKEINQCKELLGEDMIYKDYDEFSYYLIPKSELKDFWEYNKKFVETFKGIVYGWSVKLSNLLINKFSKKDTDLIPIIRLTKPPNKTYKIME